MLKLQTFLHNQGIEMLQKQLAIKVARHPALPLVAFKYNQIDSPRGHPVVRECRGIVLEDLTWKLIAKPFDRFFNVGEMEKEFEEFNWTDFTCVNKVDGSLIIVYFYAGEWHANTSGSFGLGNCYEYDGTWRELFWKTANIDKNLLLPWRTYIFELCTPYNRVVKDYESPTVFLLGMYSLSTSEEFSEKNVDREAITLNVARPVTYHANDLSDVDKLINKMEDDSVLEEGVIIRDSNGVRFKWKTCKYVALHHLCDNGNILLAANLAKIALTGEVPELISHFAVTEALDEVRVTLNEVVADINRHWFTYGDLKSRKKYAEKVKEHKFAGMLFKMKDGLEWSWEPQTEYIRKALLDTVKKSSLLIFGKKKFQFDKVQPNES